MTHAVQLHIAGVCQKKRGPGAWGAILSKGTSQKEITGFDEETTANRAEMTALITALDALTRPCSVDVHSGSEYLIKGCCEWLPAWQRLGWQTTSGQPVRNADLWEKLDQQFQRHTVFFYVFMESDASPYVLRAKKLANKGLYDLQAELKSRRDADYKRQHESPDGSIQQPIRIYTDGSCLRDRTGGWGAIIVNKNHQREISGHELKTTANRMEMLAVIQALEEMEPSLPAMVTTDSQYVRRGMQDWVKQWKQSGWLTIEGKPVKNDDLWQRLDVACSERHVSWKWVKSHSGHHYNERADALARSASAFASKSRKCTINETDLCSSGP